MEIKINQAFAIQLYRDPEIIALRLEIRTLGLKLSNLQRLKAEIQQQINTLSRRYKQELSHLLVELLQLRRDQLAKEAEQNPDKQSDYEQAQAKYDNFEDQYHTEPQQKAPPLASEEQQRLKKLFRQACKLCHPDAVADEFKDKARTTFIELKTAYEQNDLERVTEIYHNLTQEKLLHENQKQSDDKATLLRERDYLRQRVRATHQEVEALKESTSYQRLINIDDWDDYIAGLKAKLQRQINRLRRKTDISH